MTETFRTGVVVGNPEPGSRTYQAALRLATLLTSADDDPEAFEPWLSASRERVLAAATQPVRAASAGAP